MFPPEPLIKYILSVNFVVPIVTFSSRAFTSLTIMVVKVNNNNNNPIAKYDIKTCSSLCYSTLIDLIYYVDPFFILYSALNKMIHHIALLYFNTWISDNI